MLGQLHEQGQKGHLTKAKKSYRLSMIDDPFRTSVNAPGFQRFRFPERLLPPWEA